MYPKPDAFSLHHLRIFLAVAELGSFSRAAEALFISQPAVSAQVRQLERQLGTELIERVGPRWRLSADGQTVREYALRIFALLEEMCATLNDAGELVAGRLVVGASTTVGEYLLPKLLGRFRERYPGVTLGLEIANTKAIVGRILDRRLHLGLIGDVVRAEGLEVQPLCTDEIVIIASPKHHLAGEQSVDPAKIAEQGFVLREPGSATRRIAEEAFGRCGVVPRPVMELGSNEAVKRAVAANLGLGVISRYAIASELAARELIVINVNGFRCERQLSAVRLRDRRLTRAERAFLEMLATMLAPSPS